MGTVGSERELLSIVSELIKVLHLQAKETEKLASHLEQTTTRLPAPPQFSVVVSELSALQVRIRKLNGESNADPA